MVSIVCSNTCGGFSNVAEVGIGTHSLEVNVALLR